MTRQSRLALSILMAGFTLAALPDAAFAQLSRTPTAPAPICGNAVVESGESCDDGGLCAGTKTACKAAADCARGVACVAVAGDGCDASCATESQAPQRYVAPMQQTATVMVEQPKYEVYRAPQEYTAVVQQEEPKLQYVAPQYTLVEQRPVVVEKKQEPMGFSAQANPTGTVRQDPQLEAKTQASATATVYQEPQLEYKTEASATATAVRQEPQLEYKTEASATYTAPPRCGNGIKETGESCDDGNLTDGDGCSSSCLLEMQRMPLRQEAAVIQQTPTYTAAPLKQETAILYVPCGNGKTESDLGEACDDGNRIDGDGCSSSCKLELRAVVDRTYNTVPSSNDLAAKTPGQVYEIADPCKDFDPSKDYDGDVCTKESCDPSVGKIVSKPAGQCLAADPACDPASCAYKKPECKVSGPATATQGDKVTFTVTDAAGLPFTNFECKEGPAPAAGTEATAVSVSQADYTNAAYSTAYTKSEVTLSSYRKTNAATTATGLKEGTYDTTADGDKTVSCTVTGPGGPSDPCNTTIRVSECAFSCGQPNGDLNGERSTSVGLDADCKLLKKPDASQCAVSIDGGTNALVPDTGLVDVPTDASGLHTFDVVCDTGKSKAYCKDAIEVHPVCEAINVTINGVDGTGQSARLGDLIGVSIGAKGAKSCTTLVNGLKMAADASGVVAFKVEQTGGLSIDAVCQDGPDLKGNSMVAACPGVKIPVAAVACGNKILETGEVCDDGNNDVTDACVSCQKASCGDGAVHAGVEECDNGKANANGGDCTLTCRLPACGDGFVQKSIGEQCDDGGTASNDGCSSACALEKCGDGIEQTNESCDTSLVYEGKECTADCKGFTAKAAISIAEKTVETPPPAQGEILPLGPAKQESSVPLQTTPSDLVLKKTGEATVITEGPRTKLGTLEEAAPLPPAAAAPTDTPPPVDECAKQYPNKESNEYQCCKAYSGPEATIETMSRSKRGSMECCLQGIIKPHADGVLTPEEDQACFCHQQPQFPFCMPCLGPQQVGDLNTCLQGMPKPPLSVTIDSGKVLFTAEGMKASANLCECPSPQSVSSSFACSTRGDLAAFFETPIGFSCLYPEQVEYFRSKGADIADDPAGYRFKLPMAETVCARLGGEAQPYEPETPKPATEKLGLIEEKRSTEAIALEQATVEDTKDAASLREALSAGVTREKVVNTTPPSESLLVKTRELTPLEPERNRRVLCSLLRPACVCEGPDEPDTQPTVPPPPETPAATTPAAEPNLKIAVCRWNDDHAILLDSGEEIPLKDACPALTLKAFTSAESYNLYQVVSRYYGKPNSEHLAEVRAAILAELNNAKPGAEAIISTSSLSLPAAEDGASLAVVDLAAVREQFAVKKNIEMRDDGTLKVKDAKALLAIAPSSAALTTEPEIVSPARLFKNASEAAGVSAASTSVLVVGTDAAAATGGLGGCSLIR